jgi:hypothetical protein
MQSECDLVGDSLRRSGVRSADRSLGIEVGPGSQVVVVGAWSQIKGIKGAELIAGGPAASGVYAHFAWSGGAALALEDPAGAVVRRLRGSVGLIAATQGESTGKAIWLVTGTDAAGVMAAARAFTAARLDGHFAVAVDGSRVIPLPVDASS